MPDGPDPGIFTFTSVEEPREVPEVTVTVGSVTLDGFNSKFIGSSDGTGIYTDYQIFNRYESDQHIYMMPLASPTGFQGGSAAFVQLAAPTLLWICDWTAARLNQKPVAPSISLLADPDWILLDNLPETAMISLAADGTSPIYRISSTYVFGHRNPSLDVAVHLRYGRPPWMRDDFVRFMTENDFLQGLIDDSIVKGGGGMMGTVGAGGSVGTGGGPGFSTGGGIGGSAGTGGSFG